ncbi:MAG: hypothetical protein U0T36_09280 [Saprospiraceae bacterium]
MNRKYYIIFIVFIIIFSAFEIINLKSLKRDQVDLGRTFIEISDETEIVKRQKYNEIAKLEKRILFEILFFEVLICVSILLLIYTVSNKLLKKE